MSTEVVLWMTGVVTEACLVGLLLYRRVWRRLPMFLAYCIWDLSSNLLVYLAYNKVSKAAYITIYLSQTVVDSVLVFCVLVEIAHSVLQPLGSQFARRASAAVGVLLVSVGAVAWWLAVVPGTGNIAEHVRWILDLQRATSITRILFFLGLAGSSRLLSIGLRDRELQVATGFGVYSLVSMATEMIKSHPAWGLSFRTLNQIGVATFVAMLLYWVIAYMKKDALRKPITAQMQNFLYGLAGSARETRSAIQGEDSARKRD